VGRAKSLHAMGCKEQRTGLLLCRNLHIQSVVVHFKAHIQSYFQEDNLFDLGQKAHVFQK